MPQLDIETFFPQFFWLVVSFSLLYFLLNKFCLPQLTKIFEERDAKISGLLSRAEQARDEAAKLKAEYEAILANAVKSKDIMIAEAIKEIAKMTEEKMVEHNYDLDAILLISEEKMQVFQAQTYLQVEKIAHEATQNILTNLLGIEVKSELIASSIHNAKESRGSV